MIIRNVVVQGNWIVPLQLYPCLSVQMRPLLKWGSRFHLQWSDDPHLHSGPCLQTELHHFPNIFEHVFSCCLWISHLLCPRIYAHLAIGVYTVLPHSEKHVHV